MGHQGHSYAAEDATDKTTHLAPLDERLVQTIWYQQLLKSDVLVTPDGRPVQVFDAGQWNAEAGPDFRNADISIGGLRFRGDVEIHVNATDWDKHGHTRDFEYNNVILHAVLFRDDDRIADDLHNGHLVPRLALEDFLEPDLDSIRQALAGEEYYHTLSETDNTPGCRHEVARMSNGHLNDFLLEAARERMEVRVERYAHQSETTSLDQALYQALMTSLGHKGSKTLFFLLARRTPLDDLRLMLRNVHRAQLAPAIESILLNVSGLTSAWAMPDEPTDSPAQAYKAQVERHWNEFGRYFSDRLIPPTRRWMSGMRPANFPMRRLAGLSYLLADAAFDTGLTKWFANQFYASMQRQPKASRDFKQEIKKLISLFASEQPSYWNAHYTFGGKEQARPMVLIGDDKAASMLFNAVLPVMLLYARHMGDDLLEKYVWRIHAHFPSLQENTITKFMRHRLFGTNTPMPAGLTFRLEFQNQALIQIYNQCCSNASLTCNQCIFKAARV